MDQKITQMNHLYNQITSDQSTLELSPFIQAFLMLQKYNFLFADLKGTIMVLTKRLDILNVYRELVQACVANKTISSQIAALRTAKDLSSVNAARKKAGEAVANMRRSTLLACQLATKHEDENWAEGVTDLAAFYTEWDGH